MIISNNNDGDKLEELFLSVFTGFAWYLFVFPLSFLMYGSNGDILLNDVTVIRQRDMKNIFIHRLKLLFIENLFFSLVYTSFFFIGCFIIDPSGFASYFYYVPIIIMSVFMTLNVMGIVYILVYMLSKSKLTAFFISMLIILPDFMSQMGMIGIDMMIIFKPLLITTCGMFFYTIDNILIEVFILLCKNLVLLALGYFIFEGRKLKISRNIKRLSIIALVSFLISALMCISIGDGLNSTADYLLNTLGRPVTIQAFDITKLLFDGASFFILLIFSGNIMREDIDCSYVYTFSRNASRTAWFKKKYISILINCAVFYAVQLLTMLIYSLMTGGTVESLASLLFAILAIIVCRYMMDILFIVIANIISLKASSIASIFIVWAVHTPLFIATSAAFNSGSWLLALFPAGHQAIPLHEIKYINQELLSIAPISNFTLWVTLLYIGICYVAVSIVGVRIIKKYEFI